VLSLGAFNGCSSAVFAILVANGSAQKNGAFNAPRAPWRQQILAVASSSQATFCESSTRAVHKAARVERRRYLPGSRSSLPLGEC
jgi:hypothetical protein